MLMSQVKQKRNRARIIILAAAFGTGLVALNPTPSAELSKQVFITIADVAMCLMLWDTYFDEELAKKNVQSLFSELLVIVLSSIFTSYVLAKGIAVSMSYFTNMLGSIGWVVSGLFAAIATGLLGMSWASYCDDWYRNSQSKK
jgi:uncharacterized protein (DUF697 family)